MVGTVGSACLWPHQSARTPMRWPWSGAPALPPARTTKIHGVGFVKIHAPWNVLCREAEFLKLKMPTKKLYHISETRGLLKKINSVLQKITDPIQPKVAEHRPQTTKRLSYPFSREKQHLFDLSDKDSFFDSKTRSTIVYEILKRTTCTKAKYSMGITSLLANGVYSAAYPLHDGDYEGDNVEFNDRKLLYEEWASYGVFYKYQPIDLVRKYFGEKIGLYFAWLGVYTQMLIPASVVGIIVFLYGWATVDDNIPRNRTSWDWDPSPQTWYPTQQPPPHLQTGKSQARPGTVRTRDAPSEGFNSRLRAWAAFAGTLALGDILLSRGRHKINIRLLFVL